MFYYSMLAFLIFVAFITHIILAYFTHSLLEEVDSTGWYKPKYKKYLLIPGVALGGIMYVFISEFLKD